MNMGNFGVGGFGAHGMPRINISGGDWHPKNLWAAVMTGKGFTAPRKTGLLMIGMAVAFMVINIVLLFIHLYYPYLFALACPIWWGGLWLAIVGQPRATPDGSPAPMWSRVLLGACLVFGILQGVFLCIFPGFVAFGA
jgi:hypothetical protein